MISYFIDQIPLWLYVAVGLLGVGALFYFFSPILIPLWNITPKPVKIVGAAIVAALGAYIAGRNKGNKDARDLQKRNDAQAVEHRNEINQEVNNLPKPDVDRRLDGWMRD